MISDVLTIPTRNGSDATSVVGRGSGARGFVIGPENSLVVESIVRPFMEEQEVEFFPILLFGETGAGKTHLLQTLASFVRRNALVTDANAFSAECTEAVQVDEMAAFEARFLRCGFLFFDDIDYLARKQVAQRRFARILELRVSACKPTVITAKKPPHALKLPNGLVSRLSQGVTVPLAYPSNETREQLLRVLAEQAQLSIDDEAIPKIAKSNPTAPALLRQVLQLQTKGVLLEDSEQPANGNSSGDNQKSIDPPLVIRATARYYGLDRSDLCGSSRRKQHVLARSMAMYLLRSRSNLSYQDIGKLFGKRDHTTVLHACRKIETLLENETLTQNARSDILKRCDSTC